MNKKTNKSGADHVLHLVAKFEPKSVREMSVEEYEAEFDTKFPAPDPTPKPARAKVVDPWVRIAEEILERNFCEEPIDRSTRKSLMIGLRGRDHPNARTALAKLAGVKPVRWRKKDLKAGHLLPRVRKPNGPRKASANNPPR